jgi:mannonate dehydratase
MKRRTFSKAIISSIGLSAIGDNLFHINTQQINASGNSWSAKGLKLGISHQKPDELHEKHLNYLKQMGVEYLEIRIPSEQSSYKNIKDIRDRVENAGLKVFEIMLADKYNLKASALGLPERDEEILFFQNFLRDLGKVGIDTTTYAWHTGGVYQTGTTMTRGCRTRLFELESAEREPSIYDKKFTEAQLWSNYEYFIKHVLPVAEDAGVRLQLHPNDPPVAHQGVPRIFSSTKAFQNAMEISNHSPYSGILFCTGTFAEMYGSDGKGEDLVQAIYEFGSKGHIYQVHFRNVSSNLPIFHETFPDNGYINMYKVMKALRQANVNGMVVPDHTPLCENSEAGPETSEAYVFGYIRALIQAVDTELGRVS